MLRLLATSKILPHLTLMITSLGLFLERSSSVLVVMLSFIFAMALVGHSLLGAPAGSSRSECVYACEAKRRYRLLLGVAVPGAKRLANSLARRGD